MENKKENNLADFWGIDKLYRFTLKPNNWTNKKNKIVYVSEKNKDLATRYINENFISNCQKGHKIIKIVHLGNAISGMCWTNKTLNK